MSGRTLRSCSSTSTTSRRSTTASVTLLVTSCSGSSARASLSSVRSNDIVVRLGGDEFAVLLIDADVDDARAVAERLDKEHRRALRPRHGQSTDRREHRHISILETDADDSAGLLRCADVAMFRAKTGNTSFAFYDQSLDDDNVLLMAEELRIAVEEKQFVLHYQPQLDLRTGEITAVEALLRWHNPSAWGWSRLSNSCRSPKRPD